MTASVESRADAARALHRVVFEHETLDQAASGGQLSSEAQEMLYGSLRHYFSLSASVNRTLHRPLKAKDHIIWCLMLVGAYQRFYMRVPDHAAMNETVEACRTLGRPWAKGLVNAVLRRITQTERSFEHPDWMQRRLREDYGADAEAIMLANNERAPMTLRVNAARTSPADYEAALQQAGIAFRRRTKVFVQGSVSLTTGPETLILQSPVPSRGLPGYDEGLVSIQDAGAQFAAHLLEPGAGGRVLDACAAPGGKLFHLAERFPEALITGLEVSPARLERLRQEARRLQHPVADRGAEQRAPGTVEQGLRLLQADARNLDWWDGTPYDHILLDAPCSGSGTLRRHPDIKILRQAADLQKYAELQESLLVNLWHVLRGGGTLLYCTCSLFAKENDDVIAGFTASHADATLVPFALDSGRPTRCGWQLLPTDTDTDGFYYARLRRSA